MNNILDIFCLDFVPNLNFRAIYLFPSSVKGKVKLSLYRPWRPLGLREVEAPTFSDIRLTDGGKVVSGHR
jgi:hypothetical protein